MGVKRWSPEGTTNHRSQNPVISKAILNQVFLTRQLKLQLPKLEGLEIDNIEEQQFLWQTGTLFVQDISSLKNLKFGSCPKNLKIES